MSVETSKLNEKSLLTISEKIDDYIIPIEVAAEMKQVSEQSIYQAIGRGELRRVNGVTLSSLVEYEVDKKRRLAGRIRALLKKEKKEKKEEKGE